MRKLTGISALAAMLSLSACQTIDFGGPVAVAPPVGAAEGQWVGTDGVAVSTFSNGTFSSSATDTGSKLAEGSYRYTDAQSVSITFKSLLRGTTVNANCAVVTSSQMNCTSSSGAQFSLLRRASAPV
jgi:phage gp45-like